MGEVNLRVAHELLKRGPARRTRKQFFSDLKLSDNTFRSKNNGAAIGAIQDEEKSGERFFDSTGRNSLAFGPGAGLVVGVSIGSESLRAAIFDANGVQHHLHTAEPMPGQLKVDPKILIDRIKTEVLKVIKDSLDDNKLLIGDELPLLGVSVAWPSALAHDKAPVGNALSHEGWGRRPVNLRLASALGLSPDRSHALNDVNAAAISIAFDRTQLKSHQENKYTHITAVLRLAGGIGGATVVIEPHSEGRSGFIDTILLGGVDSLAGEIGHVHVSKDFIGSVNKKLPKKLKPLHPVECSCANHGKTVPYHLEALVSANAAAARMGTGVTMSEAIASIHEDPGSTVNKRILKDTAQVLGWTLMGPVTWLNPAEIVLTGSMAMPELSATLAETISDDSHESVTTPTVTVLEGEENELVRARGAALVVIRRHVFRDFGTILTGSDAEEHRRNVRKLTYRVKSPDKLGG